MNLILTSQQTTALLFYRLPTVHLAGTLHELCPNFDVSVVYFIYARVFDGKPPLGNSAP